MSETSPLSQMADELGDLEHELAPLKAKIKRAESLRASLRGAYKDTPAATSIAVAGERWHVLLGPCGNESVINTTRLLDLVGSQKFIELASVSLKALQERCPAGIVGAVVATQMSGTRSLSIVPAPAPAVVKRGKRK